MSTHPNVILMARLTPDGLSRKTMRDILEAYSTNEDDDIPIGDSTYHHQVMEVEYDEDYQISANEGDLVFYDLVTYGYGEKIFWEELEAKKNALEAWAKDVCEKFNCQYSIEVSANYW